MESEHNVINDILNSVNNDLVKQLDNIVLEGLKRKGHDLNHRFELETFIKERCRCEDRPHLEERTYFVDDAPFLLHRYNTEYKTDISEDGTTVNVTGGSFAFL